MGAWGTAIPRALPLCFCYLTAILQQHKMNCKRHGLFFRALSLFVVVGPSFLLRKDPWAAVRPKISRLRRGRAPEGQAVGLPAHGAVSATARPSSGAGRGGRCSRERIAPRAVGYADHIVRVSEQCVSLAHAL